MTEIIDGIDRASADMQALVTRLVAIPTENPPGTAYLECVAEIESALDRLGLPHERIDIPSTDALPRAAVRAWVGEPGPTLYFHGHFDVVPAMSRDQFVPRADGDTLYGRGSSDMKSGLVSMIFAASALQRVERRLRGRVGLLFVPDEETGGARGSAALAAAGQLGVDAIGMLLPEPTSGVVWHGNRGAMTFEVTVKGRASHVALARHGVNAVERAMPLLARLFDLARDLDTRGSVLLVGGRLDAGTNFNVVPAECRFTVDRRTNPDEDFGGEKRKLLALFEQARSEGADLDARLIQEGRSSMSSSDGDLARALAEAVATVTGDAPPFEICPGLLENRFYAERGIPAYAYGPGILAVSHGPQEFVKMSRMVECAKIYALTAARVIGFD